MRKEKILLLSFVIGKGNNLIVHPELIETIEKNTTGKNSSYYNDKFLIYVYQVLQDEDGMNDAHFNLEQKARMFCYLANSEYKMRNKYADYIPSTDMHVHISSLVSVVQK